jgi:ribosomal protein S18 acetylase RimI-like enzyme
VKIRAFDGSLRDAKGILEIDRATFCDCPYSAERIAALLADPEQYAWLVQEGDTILGYVSAFATQSVAADRWEVDELAVHPSVQGRGLATALVARAMEAGTERAGLSKARALVAVDNLASQRVFVKNGFRKGSSVHLLLHRVDDRVSRLSPLGIPVVRLAHASEGPAIARLLEADPGRVDRQLRNEDVLYLVVAVGGDLAGCAELLHVRTLQYEGLWIEALAVLDGGANSSEGGMLGADPRAGVASALLRGAIEAAVRRDGIEEVGYLADPQQTALYEAGLSVGMFKVDEYCVFVREMS